MFYFITMKMQLNQIIKNKQCGANTFEDYVENLTGSPDSDNSKDDVSRKLKDNDYLSDNPVNSWDYVFALTKRYISHDYIKEWNDVENVIYNV